LGQGGTAEAAPFPSLAVAGSGGGGGGQQVPRVARNDMRDGDYESGGDGGGQRVPRFARNDTGDGDRGSGGGGGGQQVPRVARNDMGLVPHDAGVVANESGVVANESGAVADESGVVAKSPLLAEDARNGAPTVDTVSAVPMVPVFHDLGDEGVSIQAVADGGGVVGNRVVFLPIEVIDKNPYQTRYVFDEGALTELRDSIKEHGVVQPVVVRPAEEDGRYILVLGERRLRASKMAGQESIPAMIRRLSPQQAAEMTVLENIAREDLNPLEQAEAFRVLSVQFKLTQAEIAQRTGLSRETVSNYMRLLRLPKKVMDYLLSERLSFSDCREILRLENDDYIEEVAEEVVTHKLKWDQIEDRVMRVNGSFAMLPGQTMPGEKKKRGGGARWMDPNVRAAQTDMERTLGMRVRIRDRHGKGTIVIEYSTVDDYEKVTGLLRKKQ
jgi:ParB family chromosome partitioning protein